MSQNISSGILSIFADGQAFNAMAEATYDVSEVEVEVVRGVDGYHSERHTPMTSFIQVKISDSGDLSTQALTGKRFDVVQMNLQNGKRIKINKAVVTSRSEVDAIEGTLTVRFEGTAAPDEELAS